MIKEQGNGGGWRLALLVSVMLLLSGGGGWASEPAEKVGGVETMGHGAAGQVVVARVNGVELNMAMLMKKMRDIARRKFGSQEITPLVATKIKNDALEELITEELAYQKAVAAIGVVPQEEVDALEASEMEKAGGAAAFQEKIAAAKTSREELRKEFSRTLTVQLYLKREIEDKIEVSEEEISLAYQGSKDKYFIQNEVVQVTDVTFFVDPARPEASKRVEAFRELVLAREDKDPANLSPDGTFIAQKNIKLDKVGDKELYQAARVLKEHQLSPPITVGGTLHVVQLTGYKPEVSKRLDEVHGFLVNELKKRKKGAMVDAWVESFREGAKIELLDFTVQD